MPRSPVCLNGPGGTYVPGAQLQPGREAIDGRKWRGRAAAAAKLGSRLTLLIAPLAGLVIKM